MGDICTIRLNLTDSFENLVNDQLGILNVKNDITILRLGAYENIDGYIAN